MKLYHGGVIAVESPRIISKEQGGISALHFILQRLRNKRNVGL